MAISTFNCTERCSSVFLSHDGNKQNTRMSDDKRSALEFARRNDSYLLNLFGDGHMFIFISSKKVCDVFMNQSSRIEQRAFRIC